MPPVTNGYEYSPRMYPKLKDLLDEIEKMFIAESNLIQEHERNPPTHFIGMSHMFAKNKV